MLTLKLSSVLRRPRKYGKLLARYLFRLPRKVGRPNLRHFRLLLDILRRWSNSAPRQSSSDAHIIRFCVTSYSTQSVKNVILIDSGEAAAEEVADLLIGKNLDSKRIPPQRRSVCDDLDHFFVTDAAERFARVAERFLGAKPAKLEAVEL